MKNLNDNINTAIVPPNFSIIPKDTAVGSAALTGILRGLKERFPFLTMGEYGYSAMGKPLYYLKFGEGGNRALYTAAHHANEYITIPVLLKFTEQLSNAYAAKSEIAGVSAEEIFRKSTLYIVPCVNPDGVDLASGALASGAYYLQAKELAEKYPEIPFPGGWKANIRGIDLNLQYPAGWETAKSIKRAQGISGPGPRDYAGASPLEAPESLALYHFTLGVDPGLILAYHSQGGLIYWKYSDFEPPRSRELAQRFAQLSGYSAEETPYVSGHAGYKDWFIERFNRPGYTIEVGEGENPLPNEQLGSIYEANLGILLGAALF